MHDYGVNQEPPEHSCTNLLAGNLEDDTEPPNLILIAMNTIARDCRLFQALTASAFSPTLNVSNLAHVAGLEI